MCYPVENDELVVFGDDRVFLRLVVEENVLK
jgi:hypothetical protein